MSALRTIFLAFTLLTGALADAAAPPDKKAEAPVEFPTYGVAFTSPTGWTRGPVNSPGRIASFGRAAGEGKAATSPDDAKPHVSRIRAAAARRIVSMVNVEVSWVDVPALEEFADRQMDGGVWAVTDPDARLGGEPAVRLRATAERGLPLRYADMMAAKYDGRLYLVSSMDTAGHPARAAFDALCNSWRWVDLETPAKHLEFREEPFPVLDGTLKINAPAVLRPMPTEQPKRHARLVAYDLSDGSEALAVDVGLVKKPAGQALPAFRAAVSEGLRKQFKLRSAPNWVDRKGSPPRSATPALSASTTAGGRVRFRLAMVDTAGGGGGGGTEFVLFHFRIAAGSAADRAAYESAVEKVIDSIARAGEATE